MTDTRLEALRHSMRSGRVDALLITHLPHVRYLTGFTGSNAASLLTRQNLWFATDPRYATQVTEEVHGARIVIAQGPLAPVLCKRSRLPARVRLGCESLRTSVWTHKLLKQVLPRARWIETDGMLDGLVSVKHDDEVASLRQAAAISDEVFAELMEWLRPGMRESDIAAEIQYRQQRKGADGEAFQPIVASGIRGALPHAGASAKRIRRGELVTLDFGCRVNGYCSDITRTVAMGRVSPKLQRMYNAVLAAQLAALAAVRAGVPARAVDAEARRVLRRHKLERWFRHSLGHGLGLEVHEVPRLAPRSADVLQEGQVVTIEPGVYIPGTGGVRIEDDVVVTRSGIELLTHSPKGLLVL